MKSNQEEQFPSGSATTMDCAASTWATKSWSAPFGTRQRRGPGVRAGVDEAQSQKVSDFGLAKVQRPAVAAAEALGVNNSECPKPAMEDDAWSDREYR